MNKFDTNELINCFKMTVDLEGIKKLEEYIKNLEQENTQLKKQYCERTDCSGRLGNSRKVERLENTIKELRSWLEEDLKEKYRDAGYRNNIIREVLDKLNELEGGKNE